MIRDDVVKVELKVSCVVNCKLDDGNVKNQIFIDYDLFEIC